MDIQIAPPRAPQQRWALLSLEIVLAIGAYGGGVALLTGSIDGGDAWSGLPFGSLTFAGWALIVVNGLLPTVVVIGAARRRSWALLGHLVVGVALVGWIVAQVGFLGWPPHWLQIVYFVWGWVIVVLALRQRATGV